MLQTIKEVFYRMTHKPNGEYINPLAHLFFYMTFIFGAAFTFFGWTDSVQAVTLYSESLTHFGVAVISAWGVCAMLVTIWNTYNVVQRKRNAYAAFAGFAVWLYAFIVYWSGGYWFQILVAAVPNMIFWAYYYVTLSRNLKLRLNYHID